MPSEIRTGIVFAGFRIERLVGEGATGAVYLAEDTRRGGRVALKVLAPVLARDDRFRQRFLRESQVAATLDHPNVVATLAAGEEDGVLYLAMAYVEGSDLREVIRQEGRLEPERAVDLISQVAAALDLAHKRGLVHRDVKPGNILIGDGGGSQHAYICDFGLSRHVSSVSSLTGERGFVGTIDYVPPEQIEGATIDHRADIYSLGCVLFECVAGSRPFDRDSELSVVFAHLNEPPPKLSDIRPELPEAFDRVFETALAKAPAKRYATCGELVEAARAALRGTTFARRGLRRRRFLVGALTLAAAGIATAGVLVWQDSPHAAPTISDSGIGGLALGLTYPAYEQAWGSGGITPLKVPPNYAKRAFLERQVAVYFENGDVQGAVKPGRVKSVEMTTWSKADKTEEGIGPCSTASQLKAAYGSSLKPVAENVHDGKVFGYTVGKRLYFALGPPPNPDHVTAVAVRVNRLDFASYNALNDGPCS